MEKEKEVLCRVAHIAVFIFVRRDKVEVFDVPFSVSAQRQVVLSYRAVNPVLRFGEVDLDNVDCGKEEVVYLLPVLLPEIKQLVFFEAKEIGISSDLVTLA